MTAALAGVDAASLYSYLLAAEQCRDADTWGVHLLDAAQQGLDPDYTIADADQGPRIVQRDGLGMTRRAMATCSTSSASARAWPTRCPVSARALNRGAGLCRPGSAAWVSEIQTTSLPPN